MLDLLDDFATRRMQQLERSVRAATSLGGHRFWTKLENELDRLADPRTDLSRRRDKRFYRRSRSSRIGGGRFLPKRPRRSKESPRRPRGDGDQCVSVRTQIQMSMKAAGAAGKD